MCQSSFASAMSNLHLIIYFPLLPCHKIMLPRDGKYNKPQFLIILLNPMKFDEILKDPPCFSLFPDISLKSQMMNHGSIWTMAPYEPVHIMWVIFKHDP